MRANLIEAVEYKMIAVGFGGSLVLENAILTIKKVGKVDRSMPVTSIEQLRYKAPTLFNHGFITLIFQGDINRNRKNKILTYMDAGKDDDSIAIAKKQAPAFEQLKAEVEKLCLMAMTRSTQQEVWGSNSSAGNNDSANEIAKYHDLMAKGIITQAEFEAKKKQLLGL